MTEQMKAHEAKAKALNLSKFGSARLRYLREDRKATYLEYLKDETLVDHLTEIDKEAEEQYERLMKIEMDFEGVNEQLKATDWEKYMGKKNIIDVDVTHQILNELIYV